MFDFRKPVWRHSIDIPLHDGLNADPGPYVFGGNNDIPVTIGPGGHEAGLNHFSGSAQPVRNPPVSNFSGDSFTVHLSMGSTRRRPKTTRAHH